MTLETTYATVDYFTNKKQMLQSQIALRLTVSSCRRGSTEEDCPECLDRPARFGGDLASVGRPM